MSQEDEDYANGFQSFDLTLLSNFIHQVINPLNGVAGTMDNVIYNRIQGPGRKEQRLNAARAQLEHCISLVRNLAYFAQGFDGIEPTDVREVVVPQSLIEAAMFFQEDAAMKNVRIEVSDRNVQNKIYGHPELIRQVFMNLFDNAVKYTAGGEKVLVTHKMQKKNKSCLVKIENKSEHAIRHDDANRIFDLGFRGSNAKKIVASGTGLGLYICKRIVEDVHRGKIWVEAANDGRVTFFVRLRNT